MEETQVIIVGAGPSGLTLALALSTFGVRTVVLEKYEEVTTDPRGVYLTGDAIRILHSLGIGHELPDIGHEVYEINFHQTSLSSKPHHILKIGSSNAMQQAVPESLLQSQPRLEHALRRGISRSEYCTLRTGCTVVSRSSDDPPVVEYLDRDGARHRIKGQWLIGADGKTGIVRKHFLEPTAGIKQEDGIFEYDGTWVASNLKISLPTPKTHPKFPLWGLGFSPEDVYDLFWPTGWHFCCPPGKPTAAGRFGPVEDRLWRHEFRQDVWDNSMDAEALLWEHITPMITLEHGNHHKFPAPVQYPTDCIQVLRCRPFRFTHKVVNRWFHGRTVLIGDAAHVFPPFAGQGIASGVRDAHQLAWRLALLLGRDGAPEEDSDWSDNVLTAWASERRYSVNNAARFSKLNGWMCNAFPPFWFRMLLWLQDIVNSIPFLPNFPDPQGAREWKAFKTVKGGFFLPEYNGGARIAQIHVANVSEQTPILSDLLLQKSNTIFTIVVIGDSDAIAKLCGEARAAVAASSIKPHVLAERSVVAYMPSSESSKGPVPTNAHEQGIVERFAPVAPPASPGRPTSGYDACAYVDRLGRDTKFAIVRPDFHVFACAKDINELVQCLALLQGCLETGQVA